MKHFPPLFPEQKSSLQKPQIEADFVIVQAEVIAALGGGLLLFDQLDQFVDHFLGGDGSVVVGGQGLLQHLAEGSRLDDVSLAALLDLVFQQLGEQFGGDVLVFQAAHFGQELVGQDRDVRSLDARRGEHVDDLVFGGDGLRDELPDRVDARQN